MNETILKFNYPESLIKEYNYWVVLIRDKQVTLGSLILAYKGDVEKFSQVSKEGFLELEIVVNYIESTLKKAFNYNKINYLTLMMVDKEVHMHIIPRYFGSKKFQSKYYLDIGWPGPPDLKHINELNKDELMFLKEYIKKNDQNYLGT